MLVPSVRKKRLYLDKLQYWQWQYMYAYNVFIHKQLELYECVVNTVATDALVLKHQAISSHSAD